MPEVKKFGKVWYRRAGTTMISAAHARKVARAARKSGYNARVVTTTDIDIWRPRSGRRIKLHDVYVRKRKS